MPKPPVLLLAFANDRKTRPGYLRSLGKELDTIRSILAKAEDQDLCEVVILPNATLSNVIQTFQRERYRDRIAIFHYGGHADSYELLLEEHDKGLKSAHGEGLVPFLASQNSLQLIFLNGCFSIRQAQDLSDNGIPAVVGTVSAVKDDVAAELASVFYFALAEGWALDPSWQMAVQKLKALSGQDDLRYYYRESGADTVRELAFKSIYNRFPWEIIYRRGAEHVANWSLPEASNHIFFGLPPIPEHYGVPNVPFQFLQPYTQQKAKIFFGRSKAIKALYDYIAGPSKPPILLVYGQSGVGKSSLLEAGLLPRIETDYIVKYIRHSTEAPLVQKTNQVLGVKLGEEAPGADLLANWKSLEAQSPKKALILIIDQAEGAFTQPNPKAPRELNDFLGAIELIFKNPHNRPAGKLILGYRKEYHADIEREVIRHKLPYEDYFLEKLDRKGIVEAVNGLTSDSHLVNKYHLTVEEGLAEIIADHLLEDQESPISPVLQIILTKLWQDQQHFPKRYFSVAGYLKLREEGVLLADFFYQQLQQINAWQATVGEQVEESGLALDILNHHTTAYGTARSCSLDALQQLYQHQSAILDALILKFQQLYLLSNLGNDKIGLAHDTLAPIIQKEMKMSNRSGQRALRILESKVIDFDLDPTNSVIEEEDLAIVEEGAHGMRLWTKKEAALVEKSRLVRVKRERERRRNRQMRNAGIAAIIAFSVLASFLWMRADRLARANQFISDALQMEEKDPFEALKRVEQALKILPGHPAALQVRHDLVSNNSFYIRRIPIGAKGNDVSVSTDGRYVAVAAGSAVLVYSQNGELVDSIPHPAEVLSVEFFPDEVRLITGGKDHAIRIWDLEGHLEQRITGHQDWVNAIAIAPDGQTFLTGGRDSIAILWDCSGNELFKLVGHDEEVSAVAIYPNGELLLTGSWDRTAKLWNLQGKLLQTLDKHQDRVLGVDFSLDGKKMVTAGRDEIAIIWQENGQPVATLTGHEYNLNQAIFSFDNKFVLTCSDDFTIRLWDMDGQFLQVYRGHTDHVNAIEWLSKGHGFVSTGADSTLRFWRLEHTVERYFGPLGKEINAIDVSDGNQPLLIAGADGGKYALSHQVNDPNFDALPIWKRYFLMKPQLAKVWLIDNVEKLELAGHKGDLEDVAIIDNGAYFITASEDSTLILWDSIGRKAHTFLGHRGSVNALDYDPINQMIVSASSDSSAILWKLNGGEKVAELREGGHLGLVVDAVFVPFNRLILTAGYDGQILAWDYNGHRLEKPSFPRQANRISELAISRDGKYVLSGNWQNQVILWTLDGLPMDTVIAQFKNKTGGSAVNNVAFSPDNQHYAVGFEGGIVKIYSIAGLALQTFHTPEFSPVLDIRFNQDGQHLFIANEDGYCRMIKLFINKKF